MSSRATNGLGAAGLHAPTSGTLGSLLRRGLSWPWRAGRAVCVLPGRVLGGHVRETASAVRAHLSGRAEDYVFLCELLSLGLSLVCSMHQVLGQMYQEARTQQP